MKNKKVNVKAISYLQKISKEINGKISLTNPEDDGRLNSAIDEEQVCNLVAKACKKLGYEYIEAPIRNWYDFAFKADGQFFPVNVKISECNNPDNISSKIGMFYALTGIEPTEELNGWETFNQKLVENINYSGNSDYYFLVVDKKDNMSFVTSLMNINTLVPNGNNLPFQAKWNDNRTFSKRTREEAVNYVFNTYVESCKKRIQPFAVLEQYMK